jgi:TolA-binding protein
LLALVLVGAYAASLRGGFLNYDDPWLIEHNALLALRDLGALRAIWTDLSDATRMTLGAEYLPVRDTLEWLEARAHGLDPHAMRAMSLALYVGGALLVRSYLVRALGAGLAAETAAWLFALHPVHAESVAWLAGRKDVLALFFVGFALHVYAGTSKHRRLTVPLLVLLACLSKGVAVAAPLLFPLHDLLRKRRIEWPVFAASLAAALGVLAVDLRVGATVHMTAAPAGGSRLAAAATMGPVFARYLAELVWPANLSVVQEVAPRAPGDLLAWLGYLPLAAWAALGAFAWRRGERLPAVALGWFAVTLAPTSQVLFPLQNLMADRYLLLPALGPAALAGALAARAAALRPALVLAPAAALAGLFGATVARADAFADSERLWRDAEAKTVSSGVPLFQLASALEARGDDAGAERAFRAGMARDPKGEPGRRAANNLAGLLVRRGRYADATAVLVDAVDRYPDDPKVLNNLAEVTARYGDPAVARRLFELLVRRFPDYEVGRRNYEQRYGALGGRAGGP